MQKHIELKLTSHGRKVEKFGRYAPEIEGIVAATGLSSLITCLLETGDMGLLFVFAESWNKETSSFHISIGEMTVTLNDVASLLHLPIIGAFHTFDAIDVNKIVNLLVMLLVIIGWRLRFPRLKLGLRIYQLKGMHMLEPGRCQHCSILPWM